MVKKMSMCNIKREGSQCKNVNIYIVKRSIKSLMTDYVGASQTVSIYKK